MSGPTLVMNGGAGGDSRSLSQQSETTASLRLSMSGSGDDEVGLGVVAIDDFVNRLRCRIEDDDGDGDGCSSVAGQFNQAADLLAADVRFREHFLRQKNALHWLLHQFNSLEDDERVTVGLLRAVAALTTDARCAAYCAHINAMTNLVQMVARASSVVNTAGVSADYDLHGKSKDDIIDYGLCALSNITRNKIGAGMVVGSADANLDILPIVRWVVGQAQTEARQRRLRDRFLSALSIITNLSAVSVKGRLATERIPQMLCECLTDLSRTLAEGRELGEHQSTIEEAFVLLFDCLGNLCVGSSSAASKVIADIKVLRVIEVCRRMPGSISLRQSAHRLFVLLFCLDATPHLEASGSRVVDTLHNRVAAFQHHWAPKNKFLEDNLHKRIAKGVRPFDRQLADPAEVPFENTLPAVGLRTTLMRQAMRYVGSCSTAAAKPMEPKLRNLNRLEISTSTAQSFRDEMKIEGNTSEMLKTVCAPPVADRVLTVGHKWTPSEDDDVATLLTVEAPIERINDISCKFLLEYVCAALNSKRTLCVIFGLERVGDKSVVKGETLSALQRDQLRLGVDCTMSKGVLPRVDARLFSLTFVPVVADANQPPPRTVATDDWTVVVELRLRHTSDTAYQLKQSSAIYVLDDADRPLRVTTEQMCLRTQQEELDRFTTERLRLSRHIAVLSQMAEKLHKQESVACEDESS